MLKSIIILFPFFVCLFWTTVFIVNRKQNSRLQNIWMVSTVLTTIFAGITAYYWYEGKDYHLFYKLDILDYIVSLSIFPVIFLYFRELTGDKSPLDWKMVLLFLPPVLCSGVIGFIYWQMGDEQAANFIRNLIEGQKETLYDDSLLLHRIHKIINEYGYSLSFFTQALCVIIYAICRLLFYHKQLDDFFSDMEDKSMKHHWAVLRGLIALLVLALVIGASGYLLFIKYDIWVSVVMALIGLIMYYICYHVSHSYYTAANFAQELTNTGSVEEPEYYSGTIDQKLLGKFNQVIERDKVYLQKNLRVDDVASFVCTNRTYISRILKEQYNCSFWTFINRKRIDYAKEQVSQNPALTAETLTEMCGFSHSSAFSRAFRQCEGITFREWQRRLFV